MVTKSAEMINSILVAKGILLTASTQTLNRSEELVQTIEMVGRTKGIRGHHHLPTVINGTRTCLGKAFAVVELR
ncbi:hypothetical protein ARMGADRAFT_224376 [Armillaria gallica]|uniref:Uncharacterized protein n=1 Tax=Armillaria gallica TaxID=47427 RepID=A0A2H3ESE9_ARMGA|nr:hypothetical protein ARMGADRAFT_224376 [Armillaria gallica]